MVKGVGLFWVFADTLNRMRMYLAILGLALCLPAMGQSKKSDANVREQAANENALRQTLELLRNKNVRDQNVNSPDAKRVNDGLDKMTGGNSALNEEMYSLAADIFETMYKEANGDPVKMQELLNNYLKNPDSFATKWTPEQKAKLKSISERIPTGAPARN